MHEAFISTGPGASQTEGIEIGLADLCPGHTGSTMDRHMIRLNPLKPSVSTVLLSMARHWILVCFSLAAGIGLALAAYILITPVYEATTSLLIGQGGGDDRGDKGYRSETVATLARVAESDEVIRAAIERLGLERLRLGSPEAQGRSLGGQIRSLLSFNEKVGEPEKIAPIDVAVTQVSRLINVRTDPNSEVIRISIRHRDPSTSAAFANALANCFIERQIKLLDRPGAVEFFKRQVGQFDEEVVRSAQELENFMRRENTFSIDEQRALLLKRHSELDALRSAARGSLAEKQAQRATLVAQLRLLKPVTQSPYVSQLVDALGSGASTLGPATSRPSMREGIDEIPPLLMVKVYQENMIDLFKFNSGISGLESLSKSQQAEIDIIEDKLNTLTRHQTEFESLKRRVSISAFNADLLNKRLVEEQMNSDLRDAKLSNLRVLQRAAVPLRAVSPRGIQFVIGGLSLGVILAMALSLSVDLFGSIPRMSEREPFPLMDSNRTKTAAGQS